MAVEFDPGKRITEYPDRAGELFPADLDGDGDMDLVVRDEMTAVVTWYENAGRGRFERAGIWEDA